MLDLKGVAGTLVLFISTTQSETKAEIANLEMWDNLWSNETEAHSHTGPTISPQNSIYHFSMLYDSRNRKVFFWYFSAKMQISDRIDHICHHGQLCLPWTEYILKFFQHAGVYRKLKDRAWRPWPEELEQVHHRGRKTGREGGGKGLRKQASPVTHTNFLVGFNKILDDCMKRKGWEAKYI